MKTYLALAGLAALLAIPGAMADELEVPQLYVGEDGSIWQESNGVEGLQTGPVVDEESGEILAPSDTLLLAAPALQL